MEDSIRPPDSPEPPEIAIETIDILDDDEEEVEVVEVISAKKPSETSFEDLEILHDEDDRSHQECRAKEDHHEDLERIDVEESGEQDDVEILEEDQGEELQLKIVSVQGNMPDPEVIVTTNAQNILKKRANLQSKLNAALELKKAAQKGMLVTLEQRDEQKVVHIQPSNVIQRQTVQPSGAQDKCQPSRLKQAKLTPDVQDKYTSFFQPVRATTHHEDQLEHDPLSEEAISALQKPEEALNSANYACFLCHTPFGAKAVLVNHYKVVHNLDTFFCPFCPTMYHSSSPVGLNQHIEKLHHIEGPHKCPICHKGFTRSEYIDAHVLVIHKEYCHYCEKHFSSEKYLQVHRENVHGGKFRVKCDKCDCYFRQEKYLSRHYQLKHRKTRPGKSCKCNICGKLLSSQYYMKDHIQTVHKGVRTFRCEHCQKGFSTKQSLSNHVIGQHLQGFRCDRCDKKFASHFYLKIHMNVKHS